MFEKRFFFVVLGLALLAGCVTGPSATPSGEVPTDIGPVIDGLTPGSVQILPPEMYLNIYPAKYQRMVLPDDIVLELEQNNFQMVALPADPQVKIAELQNASVGFNLASYDFADIAVFDPGQGFSYSAVPAQPKPLEEYNFSAGELAGLFYDEDGAYGQPGVYEIWLYDEKAEMRASDGTVVMTWEAGKDMFYKILTEPVSEPLMVFVQNGCWGCWSLDHRSGCLYCK